MHHFLSFGYDAAGNTATRPNQTLAYNPVGKLDTVTVGANTQSNVYDANGTLLLQNDPTNGSTLFLGDTQLHQAAGATATTGVRTYSCNGTPVAERTTTAGATGTALYWIGADVDGSPDLEINVTTAAVTHRFTDPYGNSRGTPPTWSSVNGFLNKPASTFSGLTYVGARAYDPGLGKFLSVDAVLSPFHPQQNNGYAYSNNNPVTLSDPSGNRPSENPDSSYHPGDYLPGGGGSSSAPPAPGNTQNSTGITPLQVIKQAPSPTTSHRHCRGGRFDTCIRDVIINHAATTIAKVSADLNSRCVDPHNTFGTGACQALVGLTLETLSMLPLAPAGGAFMGLRSVSGEVGLTAAERMAANQVAGNAARDAVAAQFPGSETEVSFQTALGIRRVDVLTADLVAIESKVGRTSLTSDIESQIAKDQLLIQSGEVTRVEWEFSRSGVTGEVGPTGPLKDALDKAGIISRVGQ